MIRYGIFPIVCLLLIAPLAQADVYTVGADAACRYTAIDAATAVAEEHPGADTIRIASNRPYSQQATVFSTAQQLDLVGGFADCSQATGDGEIVADERYGKPRRIEDEPVSSARFAPDFSGDMSLPNYSGLGS